MRRVKDYSFALDLSYVTDSIIAMGYPSKITESMYRNCFDDVGIFLDDRHDGHYKVYNLYSDRDYDVQKFHGRVAVYPLADQKLPEFGHVNYLIHIITIVTYINHVSIIICAHFNKYYHSINICLFI